MVEDTQESRRSAEKVVLQSIVNCEKMQPKFAEGTAQHSLLRDRLKALKIAQSLLAADEHSQDYGCAELVSALPPIESIRRKTAKARSKHSPDTAVYKRLTPLITAMTLAQALLEEAIRKLTL